MQEVVKKEIMKLLDIGIIYPIGDSHWVSPIHYVPKKGGITVVTNKNDEHVPTRTITGWRVYIDYRKLNEATAKIIYFQIPIDLMIKKKQHSHVLSEHTLIGECLSGYAMPQLHFKEIKDRKGAENVAADHLSRIENDESSDDSDVDDNFPREILMEINTKDEPWFEGLLTNYLSA
ncbi:hypothetical protein Tco_0879279 [Tanacetum coccineum]